MKQLTNQKQTFISEYLIDFNGRQAAIRSGYSPESAEKQAYRLLKQPAVKAIVAEQVHSRLERASVTADWVISRLKAEALDRSENSSHGARVAALSVLTKCLNMIKPDSTPPESRVTFVINGVSNFERPAIEHQLD